MSTNKELTLPTPDDAVGTLDAIYADVFFSKMAEYGFQSQTQEGMLSMLETAAYLDQLPEETATKRASIDPFTDANAKLKQALASENLIDLSSETAVGIKQAAYALAQDPELYKAVISVKTAAAYAQANQ
jgi:hypothetical protein